MPQVIETTVYTFNELSDKAKEKARDWYRSVNLDYDWWRNILESFIEDISLLGFTVEVKDIAFSGFSSQGDGASFTGSFDSSEISAEPVDSYEDQRKTLMEQKTLACSDFTFKVVRTGHHYAHAYTVSVDELEFESDQVSYLYAETVLTEVTHFLCNHLYTRLNEEYDWLQDDEQVDAAMESMEYTFTEDGKRFG